MTGNVTPTPVSARSPIPSIWPIYIRSTRLYSTLISCAAIAGSAILNSSLPTLPRPRSFCDFAIVIFSYATRLNGNIVFYVFKGRFPDSLDIPDFLNTAERPVFFPVRDDSRGDDLSNAVEPFLQLLGSGGIYVYL